jgi:hypothetical protein
MKLMLPPRVESAFAPSLRVVNEPLAPTSETVTIGKVDEYEEAMSKVRIMITMVIGCVKEVKAQVRERPGVRFLLGEILSCLGDARKATVIKPEQLKF